MRFKLVVTKHHKRMVQPVSKQHVVGGNSCCSSLDRWQLTNSQLLHSTLSLQTIRSWGLLSGQTQMNPSEAEPKCATQSTPTRLTLSGLAETMCMIKLSLLLQLKARAPPATHTAIDNLLMKSWSSAAAWHASSQRYMQYTTGDDGKIVRSCNNAWGITVGNVECVALQQVRVQLESWIGWVIKEIQAPLLSANDHKARWCSRFWASDAKKFDDTWAQFQGFRGEQCCR